MVKRAAEIQTVVTYPKPIEILIEWDPDGWFDVRTSIDDPALNALFSPYVNDYLSRAPNIP
jgi:hypothetical protein